MIIFSYYTVLRRNSLLILVKSIALKIIEGSCVKVKTQNLDNFSKWGRLVVVSWMRIKFCFNKILFPRRYSSIKIHKLLRHNSSAAIKSSTFVLKL